MAEYKALCMKCRDENGKPITRVMQDPKAKQTKTGMWMAKGTCPKCGTKMAKIIGKQKPDLPVLEEEPQRKVA